MTSVLPNPFDSLSAEPLSPADQLAAHVNHDAVLLSQAKATEGKAGMAVVMDHVRRSTAGTGLRVGEADAVLPATSEIMDAGRVPATSLILSEAAFIDTPGSLPVFLTSPQADPDCELAQTLRLGRLASLSAGHRELSELVHPQDLEGRRT